jgi:hypothetical protein
MNETGWAGLRQDFESVSLADSHFSGVRRLMIPCRGPTHVRHRAYALDRARFRWMK